MLSLPPSLIDFYIDGTRWGVTGSFFSIAASLPKTAHQNFPFHWQINFFSSPFRSFLRLRASHSFYTITKKTRALIHWHSIEQWQISAALKRSPSPTPTSDAHWPMAFWFESLVRRSSSSSSSRPFSIFTSSHAKNSVSQTNLRPLLHRGDLQGIFKSKVVLFLSLHLDDHWSDPFDHNDRRTFAVQFPHRSDHHSFDSLQIAHRSHLFI